jgi:hypothetical protein
MSGSNQEQQAERQFAPPTDAINNPADLELFRNSSVYNDYIQFLEKLSESVANKKNSDPCQISEVSEYVRY